MNKRPLRVAIIGTAKRSDYLYGPLIKALPDEVELVAVWGRHADSVERLGKSLGVPAYTGMDKLIRRTQTARGRRDHRGGAGTRTENRNRRAVPSQADGQPLKLPLDPNAQTI